jgi:integrase
MRGQGRVFRQAWTDPKTQQRRESPFWSIDYSIAGRRYKEKTRLTKRSDAARLLRQRIDGRESGKLVGNPESVLLAEYTKGPDGEQLVGGLRWLHETQYDLDGLRSKERAQLYWDWLEKFFPAPTPVTAVTPMKLDAYAKWRLSQGAARQTINNELSALRRGWNLAIKKGLLAHGLNLELPKVSNIREGFFEDGELALVLMELPEYLQVIVQFLRYTGWRCREPLGLTWSQVDREGETIRLYASDTKGKAGRVFPYGAAPALKALIERQWERRKGLFVFRSEVSGCDHVPYQTLQKAFKAACRKAGCPDRVIHDLRRTAARDMVRAGISEGEIMRLCGWKTRSMLDRYNVINEADLAAAVAKRFSGRVVAESEGAATHSESLS